MEIIRVDVDRIASAVAVDAARARSTPIEGKKDKDEEEDPN